MATNAFIKVEKHAHLSAYSHSNWLLVFGSIDAAEINKGVSVDTGWAPIVEGIAELGITTAHQYWLQSGSGKRVVHARSLLSQG